MSTKENLKAWLTMTEDGKATVALLKEGQAKDVPMKETWRKIRPAWTVVEDDEHDAWYRALCELQYGLGVKRQDQKQHRRRKSYLHVTTRSGWETDHAELGRLCGDLHQIKETLAKTTSSNVRRHLEQVLDKSEEDYKAVEQRMRVKALTI